MKEPIAVDRTWIDRLPKVELHLHLEGAIPRQVLWELLQKYGGDPTIASPEDLARRTSRGNSSIATFHTLSTPGPG
jgi:adenosine deaminase